ncbi:MAG: hypothetical protein HYS21_08860 [Deltaproteobacteria bacterium]|nr:hypothetical protein [Deltaproteobacteria bacterium]
MKKSSFGIKLSLLFLVLLLIPSYGWSETSKIAVLPWKVNSAENMDFVKNAMSDMLTSRIGATQTVEMVTADAVKGAVGEKASEISDSLAASIAKKLRADYVIYGSITIFGNSVSLDAKVLGTKDGKVTPFYSKSQGMDSIIGLTEKLASDVVGLTSGIAAPAVPVVAAPAQVITPVAVVAPAPQGEDGFIVTPKEGEKKPVLLRTKPVKGMLKAVAAADLNKDNVKELFLISDSSLIIAKLGANGLDIIKEIKNETGIVNIAVAAFDSDNDGAQEIYVSKINDNKPLGSVIEFRNNDYQTTINGVEWAVRTIQVGKNEPVLIGQSFRKGDGFYGPIRVLKKEGNKVVDKGAFEITLPRKVGIYSFDVFKFTDNGEIDLLVLDDRNYLKIYKKDKNSWEQDWKSHDFFGGTLNNIFFTDERPGATEAEPVAVEGRFFHADLDNDGKAELIIKKNTPGGFGRHAERPSSFTNGEVYSFFWDGALMENWKTKQVGGYMADFFIDDLNNDGAPEINMLVVEGTEKLFGDLKSYILSYKIAL